MGSSHGTTRKRRWNPLQAPAEARHAVLETNLERGGGLACDILVQKQTLLVCCTFHRQTATRLLYYANDLQIESVYFETYHKERAPVIL